MRLFILLLIGVVGNCFGQSIIRTYPNLDSILTNRPVGPMFVESEVGRGTYVYSPTSTATPNGTNIFVNSFGGRLIKVYVADGAASSIMETNLIPARAVISGASGKLTQSAVTSLELGFLSGLTNSAQSQINSRVAQVGTITDLIALNPAGTPLVATAGYHTPGDGGAGTYRWAASGTTNRANPAGVSGVWRLVHDGRVSIKQFGATTSATAELTEINADSTIRTVDLGSGQYGCDTVSFTRSVRIEGQRAGLQATGNNYVLQLEAGSSPVISISDIQTVVRQMPFASGNSAVTRLTLASAPDWKIGDPIKIFADDLQPGSSEVGSRRVGEYAVIGDIDGSTVWLTGILIEPYTDNPRVTKPNDVGIDLYGITFQGAPGAADLGYTANLVRIRGGRNSKIEQCRFWNNGSRMVILNGCYQTSIVRCDFENARNDGTNNQLGYGIECRSAYGAKIHQINGRNLRHLFDVAGDLTGKGNPNPIFYGASMFIVVSDSTGEGCSNSPFSTHSTAYDVTFLNCTSINTYRGFSSGGPGFSLRGRKIRAIQCGSDGSQRGGFGVYSAGREGLDDGFLIDGCYVRNAADVAIQFSFEAETAGITNVVIRNSTFESASAFVQNRGPSSVLWENVKFTFIDNRPVLSETSSAIRFTDDIGQAYPSRWEMNGCEFDLRASPTNILRLFSFEAPNITLIGDNNRILHAGREMERVFSHGSVTNIATRFTRTYMDALVTDRIYATSLTYPEMRWSMRGVADTRYAVQVVSVPTEQIGTLDPRVFGGNRLSSWAEDEATLRLRINRTSFRYPYETSGSGLQGGMFPGQRINLHWEAIGSIPEYLWIPGKGYGIATPTGTDLVMAPGDKVTLDWDGSIWRTSEPAKPSKWWAGKGSLSMLTGSGSTNTIYSEITGQTNLIGGQPWTILWAGELPHRVPSSSVGLFQSANNVTWSSPQTNNTAVYVTSSGSLIARYRTSGDVVREFTFNSFIQSFGGQSVELLLTRPRGTNIFVHVNGQPLTWDTAEGIDASATLPGDFFLQSGGVTGFAGLLKARQYAIALLPYSVSPALFARTIPDTPGSVMFTASASTSADTISVRAVGLQTGGEIRSVSQAPGGIDSGEVYYVRHISGTEYTLHPTEADAWGDTNVVDITSSVANSHWQVNPTMLCVFEDETGGTIADRSGNGFDATVEGAYEKF